MWVGTAALAGIVPLSGFFSKDEILWRALDSPLGHPVFWVVGLVVAGLTAFYMCRLMFLAFYGSPNHGHGETGSEAGTAVTAPLTMLAGAAVVAGIIGLPAYLGDHRLDRFLEPVFRYSYDHGVSAVHASHSLELLAGGAALAVSLLGGALAYRLYARDQSLPRRLADRFPALYGTLLRQFRIDEAYSLFVVGGLKALSRRVLWRAVDVGVVDGAVNGTASLFRRWSGVAARMQSGNTRTYAAWIVTGAALVFLYLVSVIG
jgi:NADH-quinone oxidoreductase subunit L